MIDPNDEYDPLTADEEACLAACHAWCEDDDDEALLEACSALRMALRCGSNVVPFRRKS